jgi:hypothetical protein
MYTVHLSLWYRRQKIDGWMHGWMDGWMDGWRASWMEVHREGDIGRKAPWCRG